MVDTEGMRLWVPEEERHGWTSAAAMVTCAVFLAKQDAQGVTGMVDIDDEYIRRYGLKVAEDS